MEYKFKDIDIYSMELHDHILINDKAFRGSILKVKGGWIYEYESRGYETTNTVFVPNYINP